LFITIGTDRMSSTCTWSDVTTGLITGQFANKPTCGQSSSRLVNLQTSQLAEASDKKFAVNNRYKFD